MNVNKSLLEKRKILIISHYSGMPLQLAEPNPGTFSAHSHLWDSVKWKQRDQPRFQIHSNLQFTFSIPSPALGLFHFRDLGLVPENLKGHWEEVVDRIVLPEWKHSKLEQKYLRVYTQKILQKIFLLAYINCTKGCIVIFPYMFIMYFDQIFPSFLSLHLF
jgi:hypothetical protein